jgi:endonuclease/exonuclease/phosphatase (EEP) superfamily protein YafD
MNTKTNKLKIISYNLKFNKANIELAGLAERYEADIVCIQECFADQLPDRISGLKLANKTASGKFNLAIYYRPDRLESIDTSSYVLKDSVLERLYMPTMERLLVTELYDNYTEQKLSIGSFHATHHIASNYLRREQIKSAHEKLSQLSQDSPAIMVGDYNYLMFKKRLRVCIEDTGYQMSLSDRPTYYLNKYLRAHFDLATSINTQIERVKTLPKGLSDHAPILIQAII